MSRPAGPLAVLPAPGALAGCAVLSLLAVLILPEVATVLPRGDAAEPNEAQLAATSLGLLVVTAAYLHVARQAAGLSASWFGWALAYNSAVVVVKFILSPASLHNSPERTLAEHVGTGVAVMVLYGAALGAVFAVASRHRRPRSWGWPSKAALVAGLLALALVSRYVVAVALGRAASDYLGDVFRGAGLWLPALVVVASACAVEAFDRAAHPGPSLDPTAALRTTLAAGLSLVAVYHAVWVAFMLRLF